MHQPRRPPPQASVGEVDIFIGLLRRDCDDCHFHAALVRLLAHDPPPRHAHPRRRLPA